MMPHVGRQHSRPRHPDVGSSSWDESDDTDESMSDDDDLPPPEQVASAKEAEGATEQ